MTKGEAISLFNTLNKLGHLSGVKFAYVVSKNISLLKPEFEALQKAVEPTEEFKEYDKKRVALAESFAKKDGDGKAVIENGEYVIEDREAFEIAFKKLKEDNKKVVEARDKQIDEQNEILKTESDVVLYKVSVEDIPKDITVSQMYSIGEIVVDEIISPLNK